jgi:hypothetical protein
MDEVTYNVILLIDLAAIGLICTVLWKLDKPKIKFLNHRFYMHSESLDLRARLPAFTRYRVLGH